MPFYDYKTIENGDEKIVRLFLKPSEAQDTLTQEDGSVLNRVYSPPTIAHGMNALEKRAGTTNVRREMADFTKEQRRLRKHEYSPDSREARSNELWTGREGMDGVTELAVGDKSKRVVKKKED